MVGLGSSSVPRDFPDVEGKDRRSGRTGVGPVPAWAGGGRGGGSGGDDSPPSPRPESFPPVFFCMLSLRRSPLERCFIPKCLIIREETVPFPEPGGPMMTTRSSGGTTMLLLRLLLRAGDWGGARPRPPSVGAGRGRRKTAEGVGAEAGPPGEDQWQLFWLSVRGRKGRSFT